MRRGATTLQLDLQTVMKAGGWSSGVPSDDFLLLARLSPKRPSKQGEALGSGLKSSGSHLSFLGESWCFYTFGLFVDSVGV